MLVNIQYYFLISYGLLTENQLERAYNTDIWREKLKNYYRKTEAKKSYILLIFNNL